MIWLRCGTVICGEVAKRKVKRWALENYEDLQTRQFDMMGRGIPSKFAITQGNGFIAKGLTYGSFFHQMPSA